MSAPIPSTATDTVPGAVRPAVPADVPRILRLIRDLAIYEREPDAVNTSEAALEASLFGERPAVFCHVIEDTLPASGPTVVGMALWFLSYSTWEGTHGIWLEDLYVDPAMRGRGHGTRLLSHLAGIAAERRYARMEWAVLDWNEPSIGFYRSLGATSQDEWTTFRLTGAALKNAAGTAEGHR
ncbi:GNAT family N-acetyltransferase [Citricoccus sp.]|uniref:GNAT family N-acetyltransferase n=1 Tax=Citricoccus sp. TaxID=1978372 RepID=UPI0028BE7FA1|nr:GNAT family N-acetyltransferase [Citricoccus sp.]